MNMGQNIVPNKHLMGQVQEWSKSAIIASNLPQKFQNDQPAGPRKVWLPVFRMASFASDDSAKREASETDKVIPRPMVKLEQAVQR